MQVTVAQLQYEIAQCQQLLQASAERLILISAALQHLQASGGLSASPSLSPQDEATKKDWRDLSPESAATNQLGQTLSPSSLGVTSFQSSLSPDSLLTKEFAQYLSPAASMVKDSGNALSPHSPATKLPALKSLMRVLKEREIKKTTTAHLHRTAKLMLYIRQHPGEQFGNQFFADLLSMGYSGVSRFLFLTRKRGLIRHVSHKQHALTPKGESYLQEALKPVVE